MKTIVAASLLGLAALSSACGLRSSEFYRDDVQKRVVATEKTVADAELRQHLGMASDVRETAMGEGARGDTQLAIPDFDELSVRGAKIRLDDLKPDELRQLRAYEAEHKQRKTLIHEIDRRLR